MTELETVNEIERFTNKIRSTINDEQSRMVQGSLIFMIDEMMDLIKKPRKSRHMKKHIRQLKDMIILSSLVLGFEWEQAIMLAIDYSRLV